MIQGEHSTIFLTVIKLPFVTKIFVLSVFEEPFYTDFFRDMGFKILKGVLDVRVPIPGPP